jgi:peroxiredoxin
MKKVLLAACCIFLILASSAQAKFQLNENSVVKDSSGTVYPFNIWQALLQQDNYALKAVDPKNSQTEFLLVRLTEKQLANRSNKLVKPRESAFFKTGEKITLFNTSDMEGNKLNLKGLQGKIIVLNFWFVDCSPCRREIPELNNLVDSFRSNDKVLFIGVALDDKNSLEAFLQKTPFKYAIVENGRFITDKYGIRSYPTHLIIDTEGKVYFHTTGLGSNTVPWIRKSILELLNEKSTAGTR